MTDYAQRLALLREEMRSQGLDGFVVPISDEHMSEYVGAYAQRLQWLTGFNGSAGTAVVLADSAAIFIDGRYTLQVRDQVDGAHWQYQSVPQTSVAKWLGEYAPMCGHIGYDAWLHGKRWVEAADLALKPRKAKLIAVKSNPVDAVWLDQPRPSLAPAEVHELRYAGEESKTKRAAVADWLAKKQADAAVITALDSIAWLLNIRGSDVERTPVALCFAIAHADGTADLFITPKKVTAELRAHLGDAVRISPRTKFPAALRALKGKRVAVDPDRSVAAIFGLLKGAKIIEAVDPTVLPKACKNAVEQAGHRAAQTRDGVAVTRFLHWLSLEGPAGAVDELSAAERLHQFRRDTGQLRDLSFDTISGSGPNGAIVHYRVSDQTNRALEPNSVYLVDSGGQYLDGTTDITRTVWIGPKQPPVEVKERFTRVLKGHIALARACFPKGTVGSQLDVLARQHLWAAGLDYQHGTGHGVGSYLSVHEGPQRIGKSAGGQAGTEQQLVAGMILSNEPGYYKTGDYGIRIENLVLVEPRTIPGAEGDNWLGFETLTHVPMDRTLVDDSLLTRDEIAWWNQYHAGVLNLLAPHMPDAAARDWLAEACAPL